MSSCVCLAVFAFGCARGNNRIMDLVEDPWIRAYGKHEPILSRFAAAVSALHLNEWDRKQAGRVSALNFDFKFD